MEGTKPRTVSSLGMFDLLKGIGMLAIVFAHTAELYPLGTNDVTPFAFALFAYREALMAAFFIASGYGFRKRSIHKCIHQQLKSLLKPYAYTALFTCVLHFIIHYKTFQYLPGTIGESIKVTGGFLLGLPHTATYFGQLFFSCGPMWYLLSLMIAWVLLDLILNIFPEQYINWAVLGTMLLGWGICITWEAPFCIGQGMVTVPALYVGYLAKKYKIFEQPLSPRLRGGMIAAALAVAALVLLTKSTDCVSMAEWTFGPVSILLDAVTGLGILSIVIWFQRRERCHPRHSGHWPPFAVHLLRPHCGAHGHSLVPDAPEVCGSPGAGHGAAVHPFAGLHPAHLRTAGAPPGPEVLAHLPPGAEGGGSAPPAQRPRRSA